jgi:hypothetical protein
MARHWPSFAAQCEANMGKMPIIKILGKTAAH